MLDATLSLPQAEPTEAGKALNVMTPAEEQRHGEGTVAGMMTKDSFLHGDAFDLTADYTTERAADGSGGTERKYFFSDVEMVTQAFGGRDNAAVCKSFINQRELYSGINQKLKPVVEQVQAAVQKEAEKPEQDRKISLCKGDAAGMRCDASVPRTEVLSQTVKAGEEDLFKYRVFYPSVASAAVPHSRRRSTETTELAFGLVKKYGVLLRSQTTFAIAHFRVLDFLSSNIHYIARIHDFWHGPWDRGTEGQRERDEGAPSVSVSFRFLVPAAGSGSALRARRACASAPRTCTCLVDPRRARWARRGQRAQIADGPDCQRREF